MGSGPAEVSKQMQNPPHTFLYLGIVFRAQKGCRAKCHVRANLGSNLEKAQYSCVALHRRCDQLGLANVSVSCSLFNTLVASVLNYGCECWGVYHMGTTYD